MQTAPIPPAPSPVPRSFRSPSPQLNMDPLNPDSRDSKSRTPLHIAAKFGRTSQLTHLLDRKDIDINAVDINKETPLHLAARGGHADCVELLLMAGASTEVVDERGHLPRFYAIGDSRVRDLFENPPRVTSGRKEKNGGLVPENRMYEPEVMYLATPASELEGLARVVCEEFGGSFWEPEGDRKWCSASVWELVYGNSEEAAGRRAKGKKWFHLSATSEVWAKDLARNICAARGYSSEKSRAVRDFVGKVFREVDAEGPVRRVHFRRERASEKKLTEDEMYAVVLPIIDVDKRDYVQLARAHRTAILNQAQEIGTLGLNTLDMTLSDPCLGLHVTRMLQLSTFLDQPLSRSLDQSYHEYLDDVRIVALDSDQVLTRYIRRLKEKSAECVRKPTEKRFSVFGTGSRDSVVGAVAQSPETPLCQLPATGADPHNAHIPSTPESPPGIRHSPAGNTLIPSHITTAHGSHTGMATYYS